MSSLTVKQAVWTILDGEWLTTRTVDLDNKAPAVDAAMTPWVSAQFVGSDETQIGLGDSATRYWRERGYFQLLVAVPARSGWTVGDTYARNLGKLFRGRAVSDALTFGSVSPPRLYLGDEAILGNWSIKALLVEYIYTYTDPT